ncbi:multiple epidermal growth factor-like domains 10, partial [Plakobranchus ocellatus]
RNVALKQNTTQSSTYRNWGSENAVNGIFGTVDGSDEVQSSECSRTNDGRWINGYWRLSFSEPMNIIAADIYNRRNPSRKNCCEQNLIGFTFAVHDGNYKRLYSYTDPSYDPLDIYHVPFDQSHSSSIIKQAMKVQIKKTSYSSSLNLCEVVIYGDSHCQPGKFGRECERDCNCVDDQEACFVATGGCPSGCASGYIGEDCWTPCNIGCYGFECSERCSDHCRGLGNPCDPKNGACINGCSPGYQPPLCKEVCHKGTYGVDCAQSCSEHCAGPDKTCNRFDGRCDHGCDVGFAPPFCDKVKATNHNVCSFGTYGPACERKCSSHCSGPNNNCDPTDGRCEEGCDVGYQPPLCNKVCSFGTYGPSCERKCNSHCSGPNNNCNPIDGRCEQGCDAGYQPPLCDAICSFGTYGPSCERKCSSHCSGPNNNCNPIDGRCEQGCDAGYQPPLCDAICSFGTYGPSCERKCSSHCSGPNNNCNPFDGKCEHGCDVGYQPPFCDQICSFGTYGPSCERKCSSHCSGPNNNCDPFDGRCERGCDAGYQPPLCDAAIHSKEYEVGYPIDEATGGNSRPYGPLKDCRIRGWFGNKCQYKCHCASQRYCDATTGACPNECETGWFGFACQYVSATFTTADSKNLWSLRDRDHNTCQRVYTGEDQILIKLKEIFPVTWLRIVGENAEHISKIQISINAQSVSCRKAKVNFKTVDFVCSDSGRTKEMILSNLGFTKVCEIYISKGKSAGLSAWKEPNLSYWGVTLPHFARPGEEPRGKNVLVSRKTSLMMKDERQV